MTHYADTSFLLSLYREQPASVQANDIMRGLSEPLPLTPLVFLELRNGLNLALFRKEIDLGTRQAAWGHVQQDIRDGLLFHVSPAADKVYEKAAELSDNHGAAIGVRTLDVLHVAGALVLGARHFLTLDRRQHELAKRAGLHVKPA